MQWKIVLEGNDEFGSAHRSELTISKDFDRLSAGEIGFSVEDGKAIMAHLQQVVVKQQCEAYVLTSQFCMDCESFRRIKDYGKRKIRTVFGCIEVANPRIMNCRRCLPHLWGAWSVLGDICPDQATPELMERSARLGSLLPYRKAAEVMAEFLPIKPSESFVTLRHRTLKLGERLDEKARQRAWFEPPATAERRQMELDLPNDPSANSSSASTPRMFALAGQRPAGHSKSPSRDAGAAGAARARAAISRPPTHPSASFNPGRCRPCRARAMLAAARSRSFPMAPRS